jgi:hypothetical protein
MKEFNAALKEVRPVGQTWVRVQDWTARAAASKSFGSVETSQER